MASTGNSQHSKEFFELMKAIAEARSKQEEDVIIAREAASLKVKMTEPKVPSKKMREYLIRALYCELLGTEASFSYIHAVKQCSTAVLAEKRVGYLAVALSLRPDHELMLLLVNTMQRDLSSTNYLEIAAALTVVGKLANGEVLPVLLSPVASLMSHSHALVRKKATMVLNSFMKLDPSIAETHDREIKKALCDKDPAVMGAALTLVMDCCRRQPELQKSLVPSLASILKQIIDHKLPRDYDYHRLPAPWIQMRLLRILALLGQDDAAASKQMYEVLGEVLQRADCGTSIGYAVLFECVRTVTSIYPDQALVAQCAGGVARMMQSTSNNLKYAGITALTHIVKIDSSAATNYQMQVIDCLEDKDETLQHKTLDLLIRITNSANVTVIMERLQKFLSRTTENFLRKDLVQKMCTLAEDFAPSLKWYVETVNAIFLTGGKLVPDKFAQNLIRIIAEGSDDDDESEALRKYAVETYYHMLDPDFGVVLPDLLIRVSAWVLGEYGFLSDTLSSDMIAERLCAMMDLPVDHVSTRGWIVSALMKMFAQFNEYGQHVQSILDRFRFSSSADLQQRCYEFLALSNKQNLVQDVLPADGSCEAIDVDERLSFLDNIVKRALAAGAKPYVPPEQRSSAVLASFVEEDDTKRASQLRFEAYTAPQSRQRNVQLPPQQLEDHDEKPIHVVAAPVVHQSTPSPSLPVVQPSSSVGAGAAPQPTVGLRVNSAKKRWTLDDDEEEEEVAQPKKSAGHTPSQTISDAQLLPTMTVPGNDVSVKHPVEHVDEQLPVALPLSTIVSHDEKRAAQVGAQPRAPPTEKEKLAASLFGGAPPAKAAAPSARRTTPSGPTATVSPMQSQRTPATPAAATARPSSSARTQQQNDIDMLLDFGPSSSGNAPSAASVAQPQTSPLDMLDFTSSSPSSTVSQPSASSQSKVVHQSSDLDWLTPAAPSTPTQTVYQQSPPLIPATNALSSDPAIPDLPVAGDAGVQVLYAFYPTEICGRAKIRLTLKNVRGLKLKNVTIELQAPQNTTMDFEVLPGGAIQKVASKLCAPILNVAGTEAVFVHLNPRSISSAGQKLVGRVVYADEAGFQGVVNLTITFTLLRFCKPESSISTTAQYGKAWPTFPHEKKQSVPFTVRYLGVAELKALYSTAAYNLTVVEVINNELIASTCVKSDSGKELPVLVHSKVSNQSVLITVRSADAGLSEVVCASLATALQTI